MLVNGYVFINYSSDGVISPKLGFPFLRNVKVTTVDGHHQVIFKGDIFEGFCRVKEPVMHLNFPVPLLEIYQPIFPLNRFKLTSDEIDDDKYLYFRKMCFDYKSGRGKIFASVYGKLSPREQNDLLPVNSEAKIFDVAELNKITGEIYKIHLKHSESMLDQLSDLPKEKRKFVRKFHQTVTHVTKWTIERLSRLKT